MEALRETTGGLFPAHTYLLDGTKLVAYIKVNTTEPFYFKNGIKGFDKRGRKFEVVPATKFKQPKKETNVITIQGSKGNIYTVNIDEKTCTCPGFTFRGSCKHVGEHGIVA
jgi:hypothetical protein